MQEEIIRKPEDLVEELRKENALLRARIKELEAKLALYENAHTPPSRRRGHNRIKEHIEGSNGKPGQKEGHKGITRPRAKPDETVEVTANRCPDCGTELGDPISTCHQIPDCALHMPMLPERSRRNRSRLPSGRQIRK